MLPMRGTVAVIWLKLIRRVSGFSGFKLTVVSANEAVITGKMFFTEVILLNGYAVTPNHCSMIT